MEEKNNSNRFGIASLWCGIVGLVLFIAPYLGIFLSIMAIIFSYQQSKINITNSATAGKVLGIVGVIVNIIVILVIGLFIMSFVDSQSILSESIEENKTLKSNTNKLENNNKFVEETNINNNVSQKENSNENTQFYFIGDRVEIGDFAYTINSYYVTTEVGEYIFDRLLGVRADGIFLVLDVTIENIGRESKTIWNSNVKIIDIEGRKFEHNSMAEIYLDNSFSFRQMQPGLPRTGEIAFDVPEDLRGFIEISSNRNSNEVKYVSWRER